MLANLAALCIAISATAAPISDGLSEKVLNSTLTRATPAIGLLRYSSEITNPNTGETSNRDTVAMAVCVRTDGLMLTQGHMVLEDNAPFNVTVTMGEGDQEKEFEAEVLPKPEDLNVVFLKLKSDTPLNLPTVKFVPATGVDVGTPLFAVGMMGDAFDFAKGISTTRVISRIDSPRTYLALNLASRSGLAGAPIFNADGQAVGVVGFDLSRQEGGDLYVRSGMPLLYQSELFTKYIATPPVKTETAVPATAGEAWLGVFSQPLTDDLAEYWGLKPEGGLVVSTVIPGSPAATAGLLPGDVIINFNNNPVRAKLDREVPNFTKVVRDAGPKSAVKIAYLRGGQQNEVVCQLTERPRTSRDAVEFEDTVLGVTVRDLTTDVRIALNLSQEVDGVIVRRVKSGSPAQIGKMMPGVIILAVGEQKVTNVAEFRAALDKLVAEKPAEVSIFARVGSTTGFFRVAPRWER